MKNITFLIFSLIISYGNCQSSDCNKIFNKEKGLWKCLNKKAISKDEVYKNSYTVYVELHRDKENFKIKYYKGGLTEDLRRTLEQAFDCIGSTYQDLSEINFIFDHTYDDRTKRILNPEEYEEKIRMFKLKYNIEENVCDFRMETTAPIH